MDPQLRAQLTQTIYVAPVVSKDEFGQNVYGPAVARAARIRDLQKLIEDKSGVQAVAAVELLVDVQVGLEDRVWTPGRDPNDPNQAQLPKNRLNLYDEFGNFQGCRVWL